MFRCRLSGPRSAAESLATRLAEPLNATADTHPTNPKPQQYRSLSFSSFPHSSQLALFLQRAEAARKSRWHLQFPSMIPETQTRYQKPQTLTPPTETRKPQTLDWTIHPATYGSFRKLGVPDLGVLIIRILLLRVLYWKAPYYLNPTWTPN